MTNSTGLSLFQLTMLHLEDIDWLIMVKFNKSYTWKNTIDCRRWLELLHTSDLFVSQISSEIQTSIIF